LRTVLHTRYLIAITLLVAATGVYAQRQKLKYRPFADQKMYHLGFSLGVHGQDLILRQSGYETESGETWFAEIPSYLPGFTVSIIGDRYLNHYMNLRALPTMHFGEKQFTFREQQTGEKHSVTIRNNYLSLPVQVKISSERSNNMRPYVTAGVYAAMEIGQKKGTDILLKLFDYGFEAGIGCDFYLPYFKLCPELKFSFGLRDILEQDRKDLTIVENMKYTRSLQAGYSRMVSLIFNFE